ncbi:MAG: hypothetical protein H6739_31075 [Alphaproteobacteria bacterium]|nr:hypothetical protein [Alphaproteobacteria bacterium]
MPLYDGDRYLSFPELEARCRQLAAEHPEWVLLDEVGRTDGDRPIHLLTIGRNDGQADTRPGFWLDGGTHAAEWAGVMAALYAACRWVEELATDEALRAWFSRHTVYVMPCVSPDGFQALVEGAPFLRSTLRPPPDGAPRAGLDPQDVDGDGVVRWMRFRHPAGTHVPDADNPLFMRPRRVDDDPAEAHFYCAEGRFLNWDGRRWVDAPRQFGLDLNRNFPSSWAPFSMFGMDGGAYPLSAPESRAVVDAFAARPRIAAALTNHTYTGALLTQPYREDSPLSAGDIAMMEGLANQAVEDTGYRVYRVFPDFTYDKDKAIVGVWSDTLSTTFGVPGYTLELWDPYGHCGVEVSDPARFFRRPDIDVIRQMLQVFGTAAYNATPWTPVEHPQLGPVEIGGIDYMRTIRNPPLVLLPGECRRAFTVADRMRRALPRVVASVSVSEGPVACVELVLENLGMLSTSGLAHAEKTGACRAVSATLIPGEGVELVSGVPGQRLTHMDGWGVFAMGLASNPLYPGLPARGHRSVARWWVRGEGRVRILWQGGRGGEGALSVEVS